MLTTNRYKWTLLFKVSTLARSILFVSAKSGSRNRRKKPERSRLSSASFSNPSRATFARLTKFLRWSAVGLTG